MLLLVIQQLAADMGMKIEQLVSVRLEFIASRICSLLNQQLYWGAVGFDSSGIHCFENLLVVEPAAILVIGKVEGLRRSAIGVVDCNPAIGRRCGERLVSTRVEFIASRICSSLNQQLYW